MNGIKTQFFILAALLITGVVTVCTKGEAKQIPAEGERNVTTAEAAVTNVDEEPAAIYPGAEIEKLEDGLTAVRYDGDYWFDEFLARGGAAGDSQVIEFLAGQMKLGAEGPMLRTGGFGCSTLAVKSPEGEALFGRNFDWEHCEALVIRCVPAGETEGYGSISTVNMDFIQSGYGTGFAQLPDEIRTVIALYAPLDGMNDKGLGVSVNMIQDSAVINQDTGKPDLTTTTAIRLLLNRAGNVEEALALLRQYDLHSSMGMMVHFALADKTGRSVVVEYVDNEMVVTDTPAVTNFYLAEGKKQGIGSMQSHTRYEILMKRLSEAGTMNANQVRDALDSVSKDNFGEFESTEWSIVFNLTRGEARYYHRENYEDGYLFTVKE
ncbi:MAG: linear amide C-N hydrolase [Clostridium sp.]|nr:linear amide C-N hydrolase [Clostridium sp.]